jgi:hypothetical protein
VYHNPHRTCESNYQHRFSVNVWCGVIYDQFIGPSIFPQSLTDDIYANILHHQLPALFEIVSVRTRRQVYTTAWRSTPHFHRIVTDYLNQQFCNPWFGRGGAQKWPPWSPDLNPLDCLVWGYMKAMVCARKVNMRQEPVRRIFSAARRINKAAVLRKIRRSLVARVWKCIQADVGHFEQIAWAVNYSIVIAQLTTTFSKHTLYFFLYYFIQCTVNTRGSVTVSNPTHEYTTLLTQNSVWN